MSTRHSATIILTIAAVLVSVVGLMFKTARAQTSNPKRILVLYWDTKEIPANISFDQGFQGGMQSEPIGNYELYNEYLDSRFSGEQQHQLFHDYLKQKYVGRQIDVIVATPDPPVDFLLRYRNDLFPNCPIVFTGIKRPPPEAITTGAGITGLVQQTTHKPTLDLALKFHPDTEQVFVISGTDEHDKRFESTARQELSSYETRVRINYLTDLSLSELIERTKNLPKRSIILFLWQRSSFEGENRLNAFEIVSLIAKSASVPIYSLGSRNVGHGVVGGYVQDAERNGSKIADFVRQILHGTRAQDIPIENAPVSPMFDWRQLQRWNIKESNLPPGSIVKFKELSFWEQYKWRIIGVLTLFALQTGFIGLLLVERKRRQRAKEALDQLNTELEQRIAARTAALASKSHELETFAYSVAHDLKAPLRGINGYSRLLLEEHAKQLDQEGQTFLQTIRSSTEEMNQLIEDLLDYSRLERRELKTERFELQTLINNVLGQKQRETKERAINVVVNVNGGSVVGDINGLTQALNNYLDNAIKFTREVLEPRIEIGSAETLDNCLLWVRDNGVGFDMKYKDRIFDIFQRLNRSEEYPGTGVGLAIVRKAMERMGGRAWGEGEPGKGATFYLEIPKPRPSDLKL